MNYCPCCDVFYETMELWEANHPLAPPFTKRTRQEPGGFEDD